MVNIEDDTRIDSHNEGECFVQILIDVNCQVLELISTRNHRPYTFIDSSP